MKITKQQLKRIIQEELADTEAPNPDLRADVVTLIKKVGHLAADIDDMDLDQPWVLIGRVERLDAIARDLAYKHNIDIYG